MECRLLIVSSLPTTTTHHVHRPIHISLLPSRNFSVGIFFALHRIADFFFPLQILVLAYLFPLLLAMALLKQAKIAYTHCILDRHDTLMTYTKRRFGRVTMALRHRFFFLPLFWAGFGIALTLHFFVLDFLCISLRRYITIKETETSSKSRAQVNTLPSLRN
jgi:hypothetical protein